ncbi:MAG TPA: PAS domain-containing sensor histidine kinase [Longimicrobiales bacterium]
MSTNTGAREARVAELVAILADAEAELAELTGGEVDAVVDPRSAAPILLRSAQARLAANERRLRQLLARCPVLVIELRRDGRITFANEAVERAVGAESGEVEDTNWCDLVDLSARESCDQLLALMFASGLTNYPLELRSLSGHQHWVEWTTAAGGAASESDRILLFGLDVTQKRDLLSEKVARAEAEAANKAKADFVAKMSHELRTPLNAISGYAELLEYQIAGPLNEKQMDYLRRIQRSQTHLLTLIDDVINFAKLEAGQLKLEYSKVPVSQILELCETLTTPQATQHEVDLEFEPYSDDATIWADRDKVEQILVNLVTNAIKFTDAGGSITVRAEAFDGHIQFCVEDTGCGIPAAKLEVIFQPFVQVQNGLTRTRDGAGLGLAISRDLARAMGGDLLASSEVGRGSRFRLMLPRA